MDKSTGRRDITEILLKTALSTKQSIFSVVDRGRVIDEPCYEERGLNKSALSIDKCHRPQSEQADMGENASWDCIHQPFFRTFLVFFSYIYLTALECRTNSDWLNHTV